MDEQEEFEFRLRAEQEAKAATQSRPSDGKSPVQFDDSDPTDGINPAALALAGVNVGMKRMGKGAVNLLLPDSLTPEWASDKAIRNDKSHYKALTDNGWGATGEVVGEMAATAPLAAVGTAGRAVQGGSRLVQALRAAATSGAAQSAAAGAIAADPDDRGTGAIEGVVGAGLAHGAGKVLKRGVQGLVKRSAAAERMAQAAGSVGKDLQMGVADAAEDTGISGLLKQWYRVGAPNFPGGSTLRKQAEQTADQFREVALAKAAPPGMKVPTGANVQETVGHFGKEYDDAYARTVKSYAFNTPATAVDDIVAAAEKQFPDMGKKELAELAGTVRDQLDNFDKGGQLSGDNILRIKNHLYGKAEKIGRDRLGEAFRGAGKYFDDIIEGELKQGGKASNLKDLAEYQALGKPYSTFKRVAAAAAKAPGDGSFTPEQGMRAVTTLSTRRAVASGTAPMQQFMADAEKTVGVNLKEYPWIRRAMTAGLAGIGYSVGAPQYAGMWALNRTMSSKAAQRGLMGTTKVQREMQRLQRENPEAFRRLGDYMRNTLAARTSEATTGEDK